jgi:hypothetical protein
LQPKSKRVRINIMIQRRTLLTALSLAFVSACARAQGNQKPAAQTDMSGMSPQALGELTGGAGKVVWLALVGTVRLTVANANVRPATLKRAIMMSADGLSARLFDVWQIQGAPSIAAPSQTRLAGQSINGLNDAGVTSVWLNRSFTHPALQAPIETSRLAPADARAIVIDATQIWLLEGGIAATTPALSSPDIAAFEAWRLS